MDEKQGNKPQIVPPAATIPADPIQAARATRETLLTETFDIHSDPSVDEIIRVMARLSNFMNLYVAEALRSRVVSAANPCTMAVMNAAANLEQGAQAQRQQLAMIAAGQFAGVPGAGGPGAPPFRMN